MNILDHAASWQAFLSSSVPMTFFLLGFTLLCVAFPHFRQAIVLRLLAFRSAILRPPEYFDERVLLSSLLFRALYTGVLHAKVAR